MFFSKEGGNCPTDEKKGISSTDIENGTGLHNT